MPAGKLEPAILSSKVSRPVPVLVISTLNNTTEPAGALCTNCTSLAASSSLPSFKLSAVLSPVSLEATLNACGKVVCVELEGLSCGGVAGLPSVSPVTTAVFLITSPAEPGILSLLNVAGS